MKKSVDASEIKTTYRLKIDYGSRHTGLAILRGQEVIWLDKVYTLFGHVINRVSSEKSIKFSEVVEAIKADIREAKQIETTIFK